MRLLAPQTLNKFAQIGLYFCIILIAYLATTARSVPIASEVNDKLNHGLAFFVLTLLAYFGFPKIKNIALIILPLVIYGVLIEWVQQHLPYREFSLLDVLADLSGCVCFFLIHQAIQLFLTKSS